MDSWQVRHFLWRNHWWVWICQQTWEAEDRSWSSQQVGQRLEGGLWEGLWWNSNIWRGWIRWITIQSGTCTRHGRRSSSLGDFLSRAHVIQGVAREVQNCLQQRVSLCEVPVNVERHSTPWALQAFGNMWRTSNAILSMPWSFGRKNIVR